MVFCFVDVDVPRHLRNAQAALMNYVKKDICKIFFKYTFIIIIVITIIIESMKVVDDYDGLYFY